MTRPAASFRSICLFPRLGLLAALLLPLAGAHAQSPPPAAPADAPDATPAAAPNTDAEQQRLKAIAESLKPQQGAITLPGGVAALQVPEDFRYYDAADSRKIIVDLWHNPPQSAAGVLGMLRPAPRADGKRTWGVVITSEEQGYVKDTDADSLDYNKLLKQMQEGTEAGNAKRQEAGYEPIHLIGWAAPPRYDRVAKKMYWAKELQFGDGSDHTLNYDIRILGRRGVLILNAVAEMDQLAEIEQASPQLLSMVNYSQGHRYADFNPKTDKVAEYGLAGLVAVGILAKVGGIKALLVGLLALKKFLVVGLAAVAGFFKKLFGGRGVKTHETPSTPSNPRM